MEVLASEKIATSYLIGDPGERRVAVIDSLNRVMYSMRLVAMIADFRRERGEPVDEQDMWIRNGYYDTKAAIVRVTNKPEGPLPNNRLSYTFNNVFVDQNSPTGQKVIIREGIPLEIPIEFAETEAAKHELTGDTKLALVFREDAKRLRESSRSYSDIHFPGKTREEIIADHDHQARTAFEANMYSENPLKEQADQPGNWFAGEN